MSHGPKTKMNIPMCTACVLLCLTLFSMYLTGGLYARYVSRDDSGDAARVAAFSVALDTETEGVDIQLGQNQTNGSYSFTVTNNSEVAVRYDVVLTFDKDIPSYVTVTLNDAKATKVDSADNKLLFENVGSLAPNGDMAKNTIDFAVSIDAFSSEANGASHSCSFDFVAAVKCVQVD